MISKQWMGKHFYGSSRGQLCSSKAVRKASAMVFSFGMVIRTWCLQITSITVLDNIVNDVVFYTHIYIYVKADFVHAMKAYGRSRIIAPLILNFGNTWRSVVTVTIRPLYPGKEPRYLLNRRLVGPQRRYEYFRESSLIPVGIRTPDHPVPSLVTIQTTRHPLLFIYLFIFINTRTYTHIRTSEQCEVVL
jgi:hypothetical protein